MDSKPHVEWHLEGFLGRGRSWSIPVAPVPFLIGRQDSCHLNLASSEVSRDHAEILSQGSSLWIRDLGSKNGTFLNNARVDRLAPLRKRDIVHFGSLEFRVEHRSPAADAAQDPEATGIFVVEQRPPSQFVTCGPEFEQLLVDKAVTPLFQPIVSLLEQRIFAYELLGRGNSPSLPASPIPLLDIAERLGKEVELSHLFREVGVAAAQTALGPLELFVNSHPAELCRPDSIGLLEALREQAPEMSLVLEVNEKTVTDLRAMRELRCVLRGLHIGLAYDDFGAGQARLHELIEVPPDYLKFDAFLVRRLHRQPERFQAALKTLVQMARDLGVVALAEGVETEEEANACRMIGFEAAQGFLFGYPGALPE
jgi:EAL domain-containing protein (putative c-di-GMP-specific phosphodiesterase class I)